MKYPPNNKLSNNDNTITFNEKNGNQKQIYLKN